MCTCKPGLGGTIVCDGCAAQMVNTLNDLLPGQVSAAELPDILTPSELAGLNVLVSNWLDDLQSQEGATGDE